MKIEITDRELWAQRCATAIENVRNQRTIIDVKYVENWRNSKFEIFSREGKFPHPEFLTYPSLHGWGILAAAENLYILLTQPGTGKIYISDEDVSSIIRGELLNDQ